MNSITDTIISQFANCDLPYLRIDHPPCRTSEESGIARQQGGGGCVVGAKALLLKVYRSGGQHEFHTFVLAGDAKLDPKAVGAKHRFVTAEEMAELTDGLRPGAMPPFGRTLFPKIHQLHFDVGLAGMNDKVGFNAGHHEVSLVVTARDLVAVTQPNTIRALVLANPSVCDEIVEARQVAKRK